MVQWRDAATQTERGKGGLAAARAQRPLLPPSPRPPPLPPRAAPRAPGCARPSSPSQRRGSKGREREQIEKEKGNRGREKLRYNRANAESSAFPPAAVPRRQPALRTNRRPLWGW